MRIQALVNGQPVCTAGLLGHGYLSAHVNLSERADAAESKSVLRLVGIETRETESIHVEWPATTLKQGDVVSLALLSDGETSEPASRKASSSAASNLFKSVTVAQELLSTCARFEGELLALLAKAETEEPAEESAKFRRSLGHVLAELGERFLYPVYRNHPALVPQQHRGELL